MTERYRGDMLREWTADDTIRMLRVPTAESDKYSRGVVAVRTGSAAFPGAAVLGIEAAWRAGAGYVAYLGDASQQVLARRPETVVLTELGQLRADCWVIGSGTDAASRSDLEQRFLRRVVTGAVPVVVDAGALDLTAGATAPLVLTPHAGELTRLRRTLGLAEVDLTGAAECERAVVETARQCGATVLLKGARTLIAAPDSTQVLRVTGGPSWLATAGTGDVLAGIIGTLIAANRDRPLREATAAAAWLHGHAAAVASGAVNGAPGHPIVALDVAEALPRAIGELLDADGTAR